MPAVRKQVIARAEYAMSLEDIAKELGVTMQAVQQAEQSALRKSRRLLAKHGLTARDFFSAMSIGHHDIGYSRKGGR